MGIEVNGQDTPLAIDLTNEAEVECVVENVGTTTESVTLDNTVAGVEVNDGSGWGTSVAPFDIGVTATSSITNNNVVYDSGDAVFNGVDSYLQRANWDEFNDEDTCSVYMKIKFPNAPTSGYFIPFSIERFGATGSSSISILLDTLGRLEMYCATSVSDTATYTTTGTYDDGLVHEIMVSKNGALSQTLFEVDAESSIKLRPNNPLQINITDGINIGRFSTAYPGAPADFEIQELKCWTATKTIATKDNDTGLVFELGYDGTSFYDTVGDSVVGDSKTLTFRHDPKYIATNGTSSFDIDGSNSVAVTPTIDAVEDLDLLTDGSIDYINVQNVSSSPIVVTSNTLGGGDFRDDGGVWKAYTESTTLNISANSFIKREYRHDKDASDITLPPTVTFDDSSDTVSIDFLMKPEFALPTTFIGSSSDATSVQVYNVSDSAFTLNITAPDNFEIKETSGSTWSASIAAGSIASGTDFDLDYRFTPLSVGAKTGDSVLDYGEPTLSVGLSALGLSTSIASPEVLDFGRVEAEVQSSAKTLTLTNGNPTDVDVTISMPNGFLVREKDTGSYVSLLEATIPTIGGSLDLDVVVCSDDPGTLRGNLLLCFNENDIIVYLRAEVVVATYMNIVVTDNGSEIGRLEKKVIELDRKKLINTETDLEAKGVTPTTENKVIYPPSGTSALLIYSKHNVADEYWRLRVVDASDDKLVNVEGEDEYFDMDKDTIAVGSRLWYKIGTPSADFFDRSTEPYIVPNSDFGNRTVITSDTDYVKVDSAFDTGVTANAKPFFLHSIDMPNLLAYIPVVFGDMVVININKVDTEFEVICLQEV